MFTNVFSVKSDEFSHPCITCAKLCLNTAIAIFMQGDGFHNTSLSFYISAIYTTQFIVTFMTNFMTSTKIVISFVVWLKPFNKRYGILVELLCSESKMLIELSAPNA